MEKNCWHKNRDEANFSENKNNVLDNLFFSPINSHQESQDIWHLNSGCSNDMTENKKCFVSLDGWEMERYIQQKANE